MKRIAVSALALVSLVSCSSQDLQDLLVRTEPKSKLHRNDAKTELDSSKAVEKIYPDLSADELFELYFTDLFFGKDDQTLSATLLAPPPSKNLVFFFRNNRGSYAADLANDTIKAMFSSFNNGGALKAINGGKPETVPEKYPDADYIAVEFKQGLDTPGMATSEGLLYLASVYLDMSRHDKIKMRLFQSTVRHETAHLLGAWKHSPMQRTVMGRGFENANVFQDIEVRAWRLYFSLDPGTTLSELQSQGVIRSNIEDLIKPRITSVRVLESPQPRTEGKVAEGDTVTITGGWLSYKWGCNYSPSELPKVTFGGVAAASVSFILSVVANSDGADCSYLKVVVPQGAKTGDIVVEAYGKQSDGFPIEVL